MKKMGIFVFSLTLYTIAINAMNDEAAVAINNSISLDEATIVDYTHLSLIQGNIEQFNRYLNMLTEKDLFTQDRYKQLSETARDCADEAKWDKGRYSIGGRLCRVIGGGICFTSSAALLITIMVAGKDGNSYDTLFPECTKDSTCDNICETYLDTGRALFATGLIPAVTSMAWSGWNFITALCNDDMQIHRYWAAQERLDKTNRMMEILQRYNQNNDNT